MKRERLPLNEIGENTSLGHSRINVILVDLSTTERHFCMCNSSICEERGNAEIATNCGLVIEQCECPCICKKERELKD